MGSHSVISETLREAASNLVACCSDDLEAALAEELVQFEALFKDILNKQAANLDHSDGKCIELRMYLFIVENELHSAFLNTEIAICINFFLIYGFQLSCRGSFSKLRRTKNFLRSSIGQEKPSILSLMSMEHDILGDTDLETIIKHFACKQSRLHENIRN